jgi:uroporphyrinogen-III synthase
LPGETLGHGDHGTATAPRPPLRVLITRPRARAEALARRLEAAGDRVLIEPLLTIEPVAGAVPDLGGVQAIVLTSAHGVAAVTASARRLRLFAVGAATAAAARQAGCEAVMSAEGAGAELAHLIARHCRPEDGALLHLSGAEIRPEPAAALRAAGFTVRREVVYRAVPAPALSPPTLAALRRRALDAVLLLSPRTARIAVDLVRAHGLEESLGTVAAVCLSAAVAQPCRAISWSAIHLAARPTVAALLEVLEAVRRRC